MKTWTETVTRRQGQWFPLDPGHDWRKHHPTIYPNNPEIPQEAWRLIQDVREDGWVYSPSGFTCFPVVSVGMYDGWPFWRKVPAIGYIGPLSSVEVAFFYNLRPGNIREGNPTWGGK